MNRWHINTYRACMHCAQQLYFYDAKTRIFTCENLNCPYFLDPSHRGKMYRWRAVAWTRDQTGLWISWDKENTG